MKIKNLNEVLPQTTTLAPRASGSPKATGRAPVAASSSVTLSDLGTQAAKAASTLKDLDGDFDASRVAEVRQSLDKGSYRIDAGKIADALIAQMAFPASTALQ
jgi:negative regulator of flagellin synthesis FlgM